MSWRSKFRDRYRVEAHDPNTAAEAQAALQRALDDRATVELITQRTDEVIARSEAIIANLEPDTSAKAAYALGYLHCLEDLRTRQYPVVEAFPDREPEVMS
jgi:hypothetical protein